jgi:hypothetical protein
MGAMASCWSKVGNWSSGRQGGAEVALEEEDFRLEVSLYRLVDGAVETFELVLPVGLAIDVDGLGV